MNLVAAEMVRQVGKGYDAQHDAQHVNGELIGAALTFLALGTGEKQALELWPWEDQPPRTDLTGGEYLIRGAACILAEINRLQRMGYDFGDQGPAGETSQAKDLREVGHEIGNMLPGDSFVLLVTQFNNPVEGAENPVAKVTNCSRDGSLDLMRGYLAHIQETEGREDLRVQDLLGGPKPEAMRDTKLKTELDQYEEVVRAYLDGKAPPALLATVTRETIEDHYAAEKTPQEAAQAIAEQLKAN